MRKTRYCKGVDCDRTLSFGGNGLEDEFVGAVLTGLMLQHGWSMAPSEPPEDGVDWTCPECTAKSRPTVELRGVYEGNPRPAGEATAANPDDTDRGRYYCHKTMRLEPYGVLV